MFAITRAGEPEIKEKEEEEELERKVEEVTEN